jgi:hypothetical protein
VAAAEKNISEAFSFTDEESFGLFMEGLRFLQLYEDEASREQPRKLFLDRRMQDSLDRLRRCVSQYASDPLPRFYFGVVLAMRNQEVFVIRLQSLPSACVALGRHLAFRDLSRDSTLSPAQRKDAGERSSKELQKAHPFRELDHIPWPLLEEASRMFRSLLSANDSPPAPLSLPSKLSLPSELALPSEPPADDPNLRLVSSYNLAQIYGRRGGKEFLKRGLDALDRENPAGVYRAQPPIDPQKPVQVSKATPESANKAKPERAAMDLQFDCLRESLTARLVMFRNPKKEVFEAAFKKFQDVGVRIEESVHALAFKADLKADFFTKEGYIYYERALNRALTDPSVTAERCLTLAAERLNAALELKDHWNPAQIYLALIRRIQSGIADAHATWERAKKEQVKSECALERDRLQREIAEIETHNQRQMPGEDASQWRDRIGKSIADTEARKLRIHDLTFEIAQKEISLDQNVAERQWQQEQFSTDADQLFAVLQGQPWSPLPTPPKYGDG